jgi:glycogen debranching enzyme
MPLQPLLHDLVATVRAPSSALSGAAGQIRPAGVQGLFRADVRVLDRAVLRVDDREPEAIGFAPGGPGESRFVGLLRWLGDPGPDPTVRLTRVRRVTAAGMTEELVISSTASVPVSATVTLEVGCDLAPVEQVKSGRRSMPLTAVHAAGNGWRWASGGTAVVAAGEAAVAIGGQSDGSSGDTAVAAAGEAAAAAGGRSGDTAAMAGGEAAAAAGGAARPTEIRWSVSLAPRSSTTLRWWVRVDDARAVVRAPSDSPVEWSRPSVVADDRRLTRLLDRSLDDLESLRSRLADGPTDTFIGAGVPWFLTLFGRDSLWTARMMLPLGTQLAAGTLRVLAARQGSSVDPRTGEAPGKILHELRRRDVFAGAAAPEMPFAYYGSVDSTPLWIGLLHDAWRWGMPGDEVAALLPSLEAALGWIADHADRDGDGFLEYVDHTGRGLSNQGWKDSADAVRFHDGRRAAAPIALAEVQGYAYEAAMQGAALLDAFDRPGGSRWRDWAQTLAERFRAAFWVDGPAGTYPALALDRDKRPVDSLTSNIGHLLGTGILTAKESALVADLPTSPALAGGFGLRTMSEHDAAFSPLSYHCGSIWAHDTAIVVDRLARTGHGAAAALLAEGLLAAAEAFDYRLPELYGGDDRSDLGRPVPYPAACRPQAWAAAAGVTVLHAALGVRPDVPAGTVTVAPLPGAPLGAVSARGLRVGGQPLDVAVDSAGTPTVGTLPPGLTLA